MSMTPVQKWALELSNQIKAIQTSWADDDAQVRRDMVQQELERALGKLSSHERDDRLHALRSHFPVPDGGEVRLVEVTREAPARQVTVEEALELLVKSAPQLSDSQRRVYSEKLAAAGFRVERRVEVSVPTTPTNPTTSTPQTVPAAVVGGMERLPDPLVRKLGLKGEHKTYPTQVFNTLLELADCVFAMGGAAGQVVTEMRRRAGEPPAGREEDVRAVVAQYLVDQSGASLERMRLAVTRTRMRLAGFLEVPAVLPRDLCESARTIDPETIVQVVTREKQPGFMANKEKMYWDRYLWLWKRDQWGAVDASPVWEKKVAQSIVSTVEGGT